MDQFFSWGWQGVLLIGILMTMWRVIPVAFDAWRSGNLIVGTVKTIGPVLSIGVIAIGGYMVIRESLTYIVSDAKSSGFYNDINSWSNSGSSTFGNAAEDVGSYFESFKSEYNSAVTEAGREDLTIENSTAGLSSGGQQSNQSASSGQSQARPQATPDRNLWLSGKPWVSGASEVGPQPQPTQGPALRSQVAPTPTVGWFGGGGPSQADAEQEVISAIGGTYVVQRGDDLSKISLKVYGTRQHAMTICSANNLPNCNVVAVGKKLTIPAIN